MFKPTNQRNNSYVIQFLHQQALAADGVEDLQQQGAQQLLGRNRGPAHPRIELVELPRKPLQDGIGHLPDGPQGVIGRNPLFRRHIAVQLVLLKIVSAHLISSLGLPRRII
jgi:hypothetical protein